MATSKTELSLLLEDEEIAGVPLLVLCNKIDINPHINTLDVIKGLNLDYLTTNPWVVIPISGLYGTNMTQVIEWLVSRSGDRRKKKKRL